MRDPRERLRDILEAIGNIERYLPRGKEAFATDELLQTWMLRQLQIIGEAARAVPEDVRSQAPGVPWPKIAGMRNILVHGYFEIDTDLVWQAASREVLELRPQIKRLLARLGEGQ